MIYFLIAATLVAFYLGFRNHNQKSACVYIIKGHGAKVNENHFFSQGQNKSYGKGVDWKVILLHAFKKLFLFYFKINYFILLSLNMISKIVYETIYSNFTFILLNISPFLLFNLNIV